MKTITKILVWLLMIATGISLFVSIGTYLEQARELQNDTGLFITTMLFAFLQVVSLLFVILVTSISIVRFDLIKQTIKELLEEEDPKRREKALNAYIKDKHTQEECIGFIDGYDAATK